MEGSISMEEHSNGGSGQLPGSAAHVQTHAHTPALQRSSASTAGSAKRGHKEAQKGAYFQTPL